MAFAFQSKEDIQRIAEAVKAYERSYRNEAPQRGQRHPRSKSSSGLTVEDDDSNPSYTSITKIRFDQDDGFVLSNPASGTAKVDLNLTAGPQGGPLLAFEAISIDVTTTDNWVTIYTANGSAMVAMVGATNDTMTTTVNIRAKANSMYGDYNGDYQTWTINGAGEANATGFITLGTGIGQAFVAAQPWTYLTIEIKNAVASNPAQSVRVRGIVLGK